MDASNCNSRIRRLERRMLEAPKRELGSVLVELSTIYNDLIETHYNQA